MKQVGEAHRRAKLTEVQVRAIRAGDASPDVARSFGISYRHFRQIRTGVSWKHLGRENLEPPRKRGHRINNGRR